MTTALDYEVTPDPTPAMPGSMSVQKSRIAVKAFFRIMDLWAVSGGDAMVLLGQPPRSTFFKWKKGVLSKSLPHDTIRRISYILGVYKALQILFKSSAQGDAWIRRPNDAFAGDSALERMLGGDVTDLAVVRAHLDAVRGQGL